MFQVFRLFPDLRSSCSVTCMRVGTADMASANRLPIWISSRRRSVFSVLSGFRTGPLCRNWRVLLCWWCSARAWWPGRSARLLGYQSKMFLPPMMFNNSGSRSAMACSRSGTEALPAAMILVEISPGHPVGNLC